MDERAQEEGKTLVLLCYEDLRKAGPVVPQDLVCRVVAEEMTGEVINELEEADVKPQKVGKRHPRPQQSIINQMSLF